MSRAVYKYRLYESRRNKHLRMSINASASIWNYIISFQRKYYALTGKYISRGKMQKIIARQRNKREYWKSVGAQTAQKVVERSDLAYQKFFKWAKKVKEYKAKSKKVDFAKVGRPGFRRASKYSSFTMTQSGWKLLGGNRVRINGRNYKFAKSRNIGGEIKTVTVKRDNLGRLWIYFCVFKEYGEATRQGNICGIDFGLKTFLTFDDGKKIQSPKFFKRNSRKIAACNRELARKEEGSNAYKKAKHRLSLAHSRTASQRQDWHFKTAHKILDQHDTVFIEDLNLSGMKKLWGRKVSDLGFYDFVLILSHVARKRGKRVLKIGRWEPSSQLCSGCGSRKKLGLQDRNYECDCGVSLCRDVNAARNIKRLGHQADTLEVVSRDSSCCLA